MSSAFISIYRSAFLLVYNSPKLSAVREILHSTDCGKGKPQTGRTASPRWRGPASCLVGGESCDTLSPTLTTHQHGQPDTPTRPRPPPPGWHCYRRLCCLKNTVFWSEPESNFLQQMWFWIQFRTWTITSAAEVRHRRSSIRKQKSRLQQRR